MVLDHSSRMKSVTNLRNSRSHNIVHEDFQDQFLCELARQNRTQAKTDASTQAQAQTQTKTKTNTDAKKTNVCIVRAFDFYVGAEAKNNLAAINQLIASNIETA